MRDLRLERLKRQIGKSSFALFFPNENKRINQSQGIGKQPDLVLFSYVPAAKNATINAIKAITGWTTKVARDFVEDGKFPKVIIFNVKEDNSDFIDDNTLLSYTVSKSNYDIRII